ncbi:MAG: cobalamin-dependent protein [Candidatus Glassbacteria bacterium]
MKILLVNTNRYTSPPVPPIGLEYLAAGLERAGHESRLLDLCFEADAAGVLAAAVDDFKPQVAGVTIRNIDTALCQNNVFFLDEIAEFVRLLESAGVPVIEGGAGFGFASRAVLDYTGASWGVEGPGEAALPRLLERLEQEEVPRGEIIDGWSCPPDPEMIISGRGRMVDYSKYLQNGGIAGFETQKGCFGECTYCAERCRRVIFRKTERVVDEIRALAVRGVADFHLCDAEFNQELSFCHRFAGDLANEGLEIGWTLYLKAVPADQRLFELLSASGAYLVTLSLPSGPDGLKRAGMMADAARENGIRLAVDYLCGFPGQSPDQVRRDLDELRTAEPDTVGLNCFIRLYPGLPLTRQILADESLRPGLTGSLTDNGSLLRPVFFSSITLEQLSDIVAGDPLFRIEGFDRKTNYERVK